MNTAALLFALFFTSLTMCVAMTIAWASFGHPRHARSWAIAYGLGAAQALVNGLAAEAGRPPLLMIAAFVLVTLPSPLVAIGVRQRAHLTTHKHRFAAAAAASSLLVVLGALVPALRAIGFAGATLFSAVCLCLAARALKPLDRSPETAERVMRGALWLLGGVEALCGLLTWGVIAFPDVALLQQLYHGVIAVALPPAALCSGVAAILLVASDLAVELGWQAARDPLTCVYNRRGFQDGATRSLAAAHRIRVPVALVLADIDHFKAINDAHGHAAGDRTLCFIAEQLEGGVRQGDIVARIGGEEFSLLLVDSTADQAREAIERIRLAIAKGFIEDGAPAPVTVSFGIGAIVYDRDAPEALLASAFDRADRALYRSKVEGRNRVTVGE